MIQQPPAVDNSCVIERRRVVIGLTGPIAAGKSTIAAMLQDRGAQVIDADQVYRTLLAPGSPLWTAVVDRFGPIMLRGDGEIDRARLGSVVFLDKAALAALERITHPAVVAEIRRQIAASPAEIVVVEAVKLVQSGLLADVDRLWLVTADAGVRLRRLARRGLSAREAQARIAASSQTVPSGVPIAMTIDNSGDLADTVRAVEAAWQSVCSGTPRRTKRTIRATTNREEGT